MAHPSPIRVLSVDDSALFRKVLAGILGNHSEIDLVGCANDPYEARDLMASLPVDVLTVDLEMPRMGGLTFLKLIMERKPTPVIILSSLTSTGSKKAVEALIAGAFAVLEKPGRSSDRQAFGEKLISEIKSAAEAPLRRPRTVSTRGNPELEDGSRRKFDARQIIALGASTGGTKALEEILTALPADLPGVVVVQHIPRGFSASFAERLDRSCAMAVREAKNGDMVRPGLALLAPGDQHMEVQWIRDHYRVNLHADAPVQHQRPSVDILFRSLANCAAPHTVAALLTGMGHDGAAGMKQLHDLHAYTIAQDATTSVVYGMARKAVELGAVDAVLPLEDIALAIVKASMHPTHPSRSPSYART
jgi:two-component system chemotaxis response regulator CheB